MLTSFFFLLYQVYTNPLKPEIWNSCQKIVSFENGEFIELCDKFVKKINYILILYFLQY